jgi:hypothetical protein
MRVICIDVTGFTPYVGPEINTWMPVEGETYNVTGAFRHGIVDWYTLAEDELNWYWNQKAFAPLSDLDETIIHADKIKEDSYV